MVLVEGTMLVVVVAGDAEASGGLKVVDAMGDVSVFTVSRGAEPRTEMPVASTGTFSGAVARGVLRSLMRSGAHNL
jgi:hypothetical protein